MFSWFNSKPSREDVILQTLVKMQELATKQTEVISQLMRSYEVSSQPEVRIMTDQDEFDLEVQRELDKLASGANAPSWERREATDPWHD